MSSLQHMIYSRIGEMRTANKRRDFKMVATLAEQLHDLVRTEMRILNKQDERPVAPPNTPINENLIGPGRYRRVPNADRRKPSAFIPIPNSDTSDTDS